MKDKVCEACGVVGPDVVRYRQRTLYTEEETNWVTLCPPCRDRNDEYWDEMWKEVEGGYL